MLWSVQTIVCNYNGKLWSSVVFIPHTLPKDLHHLKACGFCESEVQKKKKVSAAPKAVAGEYIFKDDNIQMIFSTSEPL